MYFEEAKIPSPLTGRNSELVEMLQKFMDSGIKVAEVKDWEGKSWGSANACSVAIKSVSEGLFNGQIKTATRQKRVFIERRD